MELQMYDSDINELGIVDMFQSLIWTRRFYYVGVFELRVPMTENNIAMLQKNRYIYRSDVGETGFIKSIIPQEQDGEHFMIVSGPMLEGMLDKRVIVLPQGRPAKLSEIMDYICCEINTWQSFENFYFDSGGGEYILQWDSQLQKLGEYVRSMLRDDETAMKIDLFPDERKIICRYAMGTNRSIDQMENPHVIFSEEYGNIYNTTYNYSEEGCYNYVRVMSEIPQGIGGYIGTPYSLDYSQYPGIDEGRRPSGIALSIKLVECDAVVIDGYDADGNPVKKLDYDQTLELQKSICKQYYCPYTENFEGTASGDGYRTEWQLGDYVTIEDVNRRTSYKKQIEEVTEVFENDTRTVSVVFGANLKTIIDLIKGAEK